MSHLKRLQIFGFHRKRLEPKVFSWQQYSRCHHVSSFVMYISGAKFDDHCPNISGSGDIFDLAFFTFLIYKIQKREYL